jgi:adenylate cyclase class 2
MTWMEVEQKFPVPGFEAIQSELERLGARLSGPNTEIDVYYRHPARDFAATDEALRIRRVGETNSLAYKGPKIDPTTKTRKEIDLPLPPGPEGREPWSRLLEALGFSPVAEVRKRRVKARVPWEGRSVEISLDDVDEVGTFVELELLVQSADVEPAKACIAALARRLGLCGGERRSYLELLLLRRSREGKA